MVQLLIRLRLRRAPKVTPSQHLDQAVAAALLCPHGEERAQVIREAFEWYGTPWCHENRNKGKGVDCGNYLPQPFAKFGFIEEPELFRYPHDFYKHSGRQIFRDIIERFCEPIGRLKGMPGDIWGIQFGPKTPQVCHAGFFLDFPNVIHARGGAYSSDGAVELGAMKGVMLKMWSGTWRLRRWM